MTKVIRKGNVRYTQFFCGACGKRVTMFVEKCKHCGDKIDWGDYQKKWQK